MVADLDAAGLLVEVKPHKLMTPRGDRTGSVIEPAADRPMVCRHEQRSANKTPPATITQKPSTRWNPARCALSRKTG